MELDSRFQINGNWKKTTKGNGLERIIATVQYRTYRQHKVVRPGWERTYNAFVSTPLSQHISTLCQLARHSYVKYNKLYWIFKKSLREILKTHTLAVKYAKRLTIIVISIAIYQLHVDKAQHAGTNANCLCFASLLATLQSNTAVLTLNCLACQIRYVWLKFEF